MYKLYSVTKKKTGILGLWQDEKGRIYRDKILIKEFSTLSGMREEKFSLFDSGEKAVFYCKGNKAFIESANGKLDILRHKITWKEKRLKASFVKLLLENHGGITIFKNENSYTLEIWKA